MKIEQLKDFGHRLIEEHMALLKGHTNESKRVRTYKEMEVYMKGKSPHFSNMKTKQHVMLAIGALKKMIFKKKNIITIPARTLKKGSKIRISAYIT